MLVVLEGLDGAGKSTQVRMFKDYLQKRNGDLEYIHFPRYDAPVYGELISRFLRGDFGPIESVHPQLVALLLLSEMYFLRARRSFWTGMCIPISLINAPNCPMTKKLRLSGPG